MNLYLREIKEAIFVGLKLEEFDTKMVVCEKCDHNCRNIRCLTSRLSGAHSITNPVSDDAASRFVTSQIRERIRDATFAGELVFDKCIKIHLDQ